ncbi:MAG: penicillin acylase family protein [Bacteroidia bacterium]|nr:penicillin acylase family protein [Bacteroidia bacterium]
MKPIYLFFLTIAFYSVSYYSYSQSIDVKSITIVRDSFGVPHIHAPTDAGAAYGHAWTHCEDDFNRIQHMVALAKGKLGILEGKEGAGFDFFVAFIKARETVREYRNLLSPEYEKLLAAYTAGVNDYAQKHPKEWLLPKLFPIEEEDILTGTYAVLVGMVGTGSALQCILKNKPDDFVFSPQLGSNGFAVNQNKTTDGATYLAINPHIPVDGPFVWHETHLMSDEGLNILGGVFPGAVTPGLGTNPNLGWATTFNWPDYVDIYRMVINPKNKNQYKYDGVWKDFEVRKIPLKVKIAGVTIKVHKKAYWCEYGPAINNKKGIFALRFPHGRIILSSQQWYEMGKAKNLSEFKKALTLQGIPLFNFIYADKAGNIFYKFNGLLPKRNPNYNWVKALPGDTSATKWLDYYSIDELPTVENPPCGLIYNTNNSPFHVTCPESNPDSTRYDHTCSMDWNHQNNRDLRSRELLLTNQKISFQEFERIKYDTKYPKNGGMDKTFEVIRKLDPNKYPDIRDAIEIAQGWDMSGDVNNKNAAIVTCTFAPLFKEKKLVFKDVEEGTILTEAEIVNSMRQAQKWLLAHFKTLTPEFGMLQRVKHGDQTKAIAGLPEVIQATYTKLNPKGFYEVIGGETYIQLVRFTEKGPEISSILPFGSSWHPDSPHYSDQLPLFSRNQRKPMTLDKETIWKNAVKKYHPGE